jgi:RNA polymerase sigma factor (sigma-70 family)
VFEFPVDGLARCNDGKGPHEEAKVTANPVKVVVALGNRLFAECLACALSQRGGIEAIVCVPETISRQVPGITPDVAIVEGVSIDSTQLGLLDSSEMFGGTKILFVGRGESESDFLAAVEAGGAGYLPYGSSLQTARDSVLAVASGEALCSPRVAGLLVARLAREVRTRRALAAATLRLTRREQEIVRFIRDGLSNKEIAVRLGIEVQTVKNHVHNILEKLQQKRRHDAARYAINQGLITA